MPESNLSSSNRQEAKNDDLTPSSECQKLYGPYPRGIPVPFLSYVRNEGREGDTPSPSAILFAKTLFDLPADVRDRGTPDEWIPRDGRLVRLAGNHPLNAEPPLTVLREHKFLTPSCLHFVRNHGVVPKLKWETHKLQIRNKVPFLSTTKNDNNNNNNHGDDLVELSMNALAQLPSHEIPVTLVCAGNRRKEQNMIQPTAGFNYGPAGVSTNVWKGVLLCDLLRAVGMLPKSDALDPRMVAQWHVEFLGAEDLPNKVGPGPFPEEPWGPLVKFGTSLPLSRVMNPANDVLIAYEANGERLQPDHGAPVRLIVPGYVAGRSIKWLQQINIIDHETYNHWHYHDNRILPPHITSDSPPTGDWWYDPKYIFLETNLNSVITKPDHNETVRMSKNPKRVTTIQGFAYNGGGRPVLRVEVSVDGGHTWREAEIQRKEQPNPYGMYWCWIWWTITVKIVDLMDCQDVLCRAWDSANNTQPMNMSWNFLGHATNHCFRLKVHKAKTRRTGKHVLRFEHPTQPGQQSGGWMERKDELPESAGFGKLAAHHEKEDRVPAGEKPPAREPSSKSIEMIRKRSLTPSPESKSARQRLSPAAVEITSSDTEMNSSSKPMPLISMAEVRKHKQQDDVWIVIKDKVYDCTKYLTAHPGGVDSILLKAGSDCTDEFMSLHSKWAMRLLQKYYIGDLDPDTVEPEIIEELTDEQGRKLALHPRRRTSIQLLRKTVLSKDSFLLEFSLPTKDHVLGLPTGKHVFLSAKISGEVVVRRYTPISSNRDIGKVQFVIKAYRPCEKYPEGGKMSQFLDTLKQGDAVDIRGPIGEFEYLQGGKFTISGTAHQATHLNMIAGGTGIAPMLQIIAEILRNPSDKTRISLVFACREEEDILMRTTLDDWAKAHQDRIRVHYVLSGEKPSFWTHSTGHINEEILKEHLYDAGESVYNLICGPSSLLQSCCLPLLEQLGHTKPQLFAF